MAANREFGWPIACKSCLGDNPSVRMTKTEFDRECKICIRPFTVFRWRPPGRNARLKKTEICQTCSRLKIVCQVCQLDLEHGLPVQAQGVIDYDEPSLEKNPLADYCSLFLQGECTRAAQCPYRHKIPPVTGEPNIADLYFGMDPVVLKRLSKASRG